MTAKQLIIGSALVLGATFTAALGVSSPTLAQGYYGYHHHWYGHRGLYNYYGGFSRPDTMRGGPGPRVGGGSGTGIGAER